MIYNVTRTDAVQPGQFVSAVVIARGADLARRQVAHFPGVIVSGKGRNVQAIPMDTTGSTRLISVYEDERTPEPEPMPGQLTMDDVTPANDYGSTLVEGESF